MRVALATTLSFLFTGALCFLGLELVLRAWAVVSTPVAVVLDCDGEELSDMFVMDDRLGLRPNPSRPGHDRRGFRNTEALLTADVVALGDSQTYGSGVDQDQAWPQVLEKLSGLTVYSMAYPGCGPAHESILLEEALALQPRIIIASLYAGNDLFDCFSLAYDGECAPKLRNQNPSIAQEVLDLEARMPLVASIESNRRSKNRLRAFLAEHSRVVGALRSMRDAWRGSPWERALIRARLQPGRSVCFEQGSVRTVLTPAYRQLALNLEDPRIGEGLRIALSSLKGMADKCRQAGTTFAVLMIPTKELVFSSRLEDPRELGLKFEDLVQMETRMWKQAEAFLDQHKIQRISGLRALAAPLDEGLSTYREDTNGHPNPRGQMCLADTVKGALELGGDR